MHSSRGRFYVGITYRDLVGSINNKLAILSDYPNYLFKSISRSWLLTEATKGTKGFVEATKTIIFNLIVKEIILK